MGISVIGVNPYVLEWLNLIRHSLAEIPLLIEEKETRFTSLLSLIRQSYVGFRLAFLFAEKYSNK